MTPRTIAAILIYAVGAIVFYVVIRVLDDLDDDLGSVLIAWILALLWPGSIAVILVFLPFRLVGMGIDRIIYAVQTKILEAKCRKIKRKGVRE